MKFVWPFAVVCALNTNDYRNKRGEVHFRNSSRGGEFKRPVLNRLVWWENKNDIFCKRNLLIKWNEALYQDFALKFLNTL